jgi:hypothetical protein
MSARTATQRKKSAGTAVTMAAPKKNGRRLVPTIEVQKVLGRKWVDVRIGAVTDGQIIIQLHSPGGKGGGQFINCGMYNGRCDGIKRPYMEGRLPAGYLDRMIYALMLARDEAAKIGILGKGGVQS